MHYCLKVTECQLRFTWIKQKVALHAKWKFDLLIAYLQLYLGITNLMLAKHWFKSLKKQSLFRIVSAYFSALLYHCFTTYIAEKIYIFKNREGQIRWKYVWSAQFFMSQLQGRSEKCNSKVEKWTAQQLLPMQYSTFQEKCLWKT